MSHTNSAVAPAVALIIGIILVLVGNLFLGVFGGVLILGGGILFVVRVIAMIARSKK